MDDVIQVTVARQRCGGETGKKQEEELRTQWNVCVHTYAQYTIMHPIQIN